MIKNLSDLLRLLSAATPREAGRHIYKHTDCGPWTAFRLRSGVSVYYDDADPAIVTDENCIGIQLGSIVEGSEAEVEGGVLDFPFTGLQLDNLLEEIDQEADVLWRRDNVSSFYLRSEDGQIDLHFDDPNYYSEADFLGLPDDVRVAVMRKLEEDELEEGESFVFVELKMELTRLDKSGW